MKRLSELCEWMHTTLIFALFIPFLYALFSLTAPEGTAFFYLKCLLVAVPVAVTGIAARRTRTLGAYLLICGALLAVIYGLVTAWPRLMGQRDFMEMSAVCYRTGMLAETVMLVVIRLIDRINRGRYEKKRETDPFALYRENFLNRPSLRNGYFIAMYLVGVFFNARLLCDTALFSAVIYLFPALAHSFLETTEQYLMLNKRTKGVPQKRLYAVSGGMLCLYAAFLLVATLPSFLLTDARRYTDLREWLKDMPTVPADYENDFTFQPQGTDMGGLPQLPMEMVEEAPGLSMLWDVLFWGLGIACAFFLIWAIVAAIKRIFQDFRRELDENGDKIEDLEENTGCGHLAAAARKQDSETIKVRRLYRKAIRKHRKERPAAYETPREIEEKAGLAKDAAMRTLHADYERARYGR